MSDADVVIADSGEDGAASVGGQHLRRKNSRNLPLEELYEKCSNVRRRVGYRRRKSSLLPNLIQRGERAVTAYQQVLIFPLPTFHSPDKNGCGKTSVL